MTKLEIQWRDPKSLTPYTKNARIHSNEQIDEIAGQIHSFGFDQPIVVDSQGVIIKGHGRREAAIRLNLSEVPVIVSTLDEYQAMASRIADNKVAEKATWDLNLLKFDVGTLALRDFDMKLTAMSKADLTGIMKEETAETTFSDDQRRAPKEKTDDWEASEIRQIILICDPPTFDSIMSQINELMGELSVETNIEVLQKLIDFYRDVTKRKQAFDETDRLDHVEGG